MDFNKRWKNGTDQVYTEAQNGEPALNGEPVVVLGARKRQMEIRPILTLATFLDPRCKFFGSIDLASWYAVWNLILNLMEPSENNVSEDPDIPEDDTAIPAVEGQVMEGDYDLTMFESIE